jgi:hypothetical protein
MTAPHDAPMFPRLTGRGRFRMLGAWRRPVPGRVAGSPERHLRLPP